MASPWLSELRRYLSTLRQTQIELLDVFDRKVVVLRDLDEPALEQLSLREGELVGTLQSLVALRAKILENARAAGRPVDTLRELVGQFTPAEQEDLPEYLDAVEEAGQRLRHASWAHWVLSHRCHQHATELLDFVAEGGEESPFYAGPIERTSTPGSVVLDASV